MDFIVDEQASQASSVDRQIVPAGVHEMVVKHAEEGPNEYKRSDINPDGMCIKLRLSTTSGDHKFVFDDIPKHLSWRAKQLADAVGITPVGGKLSIDAEALIGRVLLVDVSHYTSKAGKLSAVVKSYVAAKKKPAAKQKQKSPADSLSDIPF